MIQKVRALLKSVIQTNPLHAPGWVAAARLEEVNRTIFIHQKSLILCLCARVYVYVYVSVVLLLFLIHQPIQTSYEEILLIPNYHPSSISIVK